MPRNNADFFGIEYRLSNTHPTSHELEAYSNKVGDVIGYMRWSKKSGTIQDVAVDAPYRRKGVGRALFEHAKKLSADGTVAHPMHSIVKSGDGEAWAKAVGD